MTHNIVIPQVCQCFTPLTQVRCRLDIDTNHLLVTPFFTLTIIHLCVLSRRRTEEGLREDECCHIYPLVYASHRGLASAAGVFLYTKYVPLPLISPVLYCLINTISALEIGWKVFSFIRGQES